MAAIPGWLTPWVLPLFVIAAVIAAAVAVWLELAVLLVFVLGVVPNQRLQHVKEHPPDPERRRRNFWVVR